MRRRDLLLWPAAVMAAGPILANERQADLAVRGGRVVLAEGTLQADVLVADGKVVAVGHHPGAAARARRVIDAEGKYVLPGLLDSHVHFNTPFRGTATRDDFYSGSRAAVHGGVTTYIDFAVQHQGADLHSSIASRRAEADPDTVVDYALHVLLTDPNKAALSQIGEVIDAGLPSIKLFMAFGREGMKVNDGAILDIMRAVAEHDGIVAVHSENNEVAEWRTDRLRQAGKTAASYYPQSRPRHIEHEAIRRVLLFRDIAGARYYGFHLSIAEGVAEFRRARSAGLPVYTETCTHYLVLDERVYARPDGANYVCSPPLRTAADNEALWQGIAEGVISTVTADHTAWDLEQKRSGGGSYLGIPHGLPGVEMRLPVLHTHGVGKGRISMEKLVDLTSTALARIWGLYPHKGTLLPGADADLVVFDPKARWRVDPARLHMPVDWSPYAGWELEGRVESVFSRGRPVLEAGQFRGERGAGRFLPRSYG